MLLKNMDLVRKFAWSFAKSGTGEFEDLFQDGCEMILRKIKKYKVERGADTTFLYTALRNFYSTKHRYKMKKKQAEKTAYSVNETMTTVQPLHIILHKERVERMSEKAQFMVKEIVENPELFVAVGNRGMGKVYKHFEETYGWTEHTLRKTVGEVKKLVKELR